MVVAMYRVATRFAGAEDQVDDVLYLGMSPKQANTEYARAVGHTESWKHQASARGRSTARTIITLDRQAARATWQVLKRFDSQHLGYDPEALRREIMQELDDWSDPSGALGRLPGYLQPIARDAGLPFVPGILTKDRRLRVLERLGKGESAEASGIALELDRAASRLKEQVRHASQTQLKAYHRERSARP
jgi:hypothetical protein